MIVMKYLFLIICFCGITIFSLANLNAQTFPTNPIDFEDEVKKRLERYKKEDSEEFLKTFSEKWTAGGLTTTDKQMAIDQINRLVKKGFLTYPDVMVYLRTLLRCREIDTKIKINIQEFLQVSDKCIDKLDINELRNFYSYIGKYVREGIAYQTSQFQWRFTKLEPRLTIKPIYNEKIENYEDTPVLEFIKTDLIYASKTDTGIIQNTKGILDLVTKKFYGEGGRYDWSRLKKNGVSVLPANAVYVDFKKFQISLNLQHFKADSVTFYYTTLFSKPLLGTLYEHFIHYENPNSAKFPYFRSIEGGINIPDITKNVDYSGGFSLRGITRIGSKTDQEWATLTIKNRDGKKVLLLQSNETALNDTFLTTKNAHITLYVGNDSITHPCMDLLYDVSTGDLTIKKDAKNKYSWQPLSSSYHRMGLWVDAIKWNPKDDIMNFTAFVDKQNKPAAIESYDFFLKQQMEQFRDLLHFNPIPMLYKYYREVLNYGKVEDINPQIQADNYSATGDDEDEFFDSYTPNPIEGDNPDEIFASDDDLTDEEIKKKEEEKAKRDSLERQKKLKDQLDKKGNKFIPKIYISNFLIWADTVGKHIDRKEYEKLRRNNYDKVISYENQKKVLEPKGWFEASKQKKLFIQVLQDLQGAGFLEVFYPDEDTGYVILKAKLARWAKSLRNTKDYDIIQVVSRVKDGYHGTLNVNNLTINMHGVNFFYLSDSQYVKVYPQKEGFKKAVTDFDLANPDFVNEGDIYVNKNRNIQFGGLVIAGKTNLWGTGSKRFDYQYENHKIYCDSLDSLKFYPRRDPRFNPKTNPKLTQALEKLKIQGVNGAIYINRPTNKNSRRPRPEYPVFDCYSDSYVYWDDKHIQGGVYKRDKFKFTIDPFIIDSLETFDMTGLQFAGTVNCSEIMPEFRDTLEPVNDNSYGIVHYTPEEGVPVYDNKGRFYNEIELDQSGFHGKGQLDFLATSATSDTFMFHFDSVMAVTKTFELKQGTYQNTKYPDIKGKKLLYKWYTKKDELVLQSLEEPFTFYDGKASFNGQIKITPKGVRGDGILTIDEISLETRDVDLGQYAFETPAGSFQINDPKDKSIIHLKADSVKVVYDLKNDTVYFEANRNGYPYIEFTNNKFKTSLGSGHYNKKTGNIDIEAKSSYAANNFFEATDPKMKQLNFFAKKVHYNNNEKTLKIDGVDSILVADIVIFPDSGKVEIQDGGSIKTLFDAKFIANTTDRYHNLFDADIKILSRLDYSSGTKYQYPIYNQKIQFIDISASERDTVSKGYAMIAEDQNFFITDRVFFRDSVIFTANQKFMRFNGEVKIDSRNPALKDAWIPFNQIVNPDTIFIPIDKSITISKKTKKELTVGLHFIPYRRVFYSNFLQERRDQKKDKDICLAKGGLSVERNSGEFKIGPKNKIEQQQYRGNLVIYNDSLNIITTRGLINLNYLIYPNTAKIKIAGEFVQDMNKQTIRTDHCMTVDFSIIPKNASSIIATKFYSYTADNPDIEYDKRLLQENLAEFIDSTDTSEPNTKKLVQSLEFITNIRNQIKIGKNIEDLLFFSNVRWKWIDQFKAFYHDGPIGVVSINGQPINKMVNCKMDYVIGTTNPDGKMQKPDTLRIYLNIDDTWIFYHFAGNVLKTTASTTAYNNAIKEALNKQNKKKLDPTKHEFQLAPCDEDNKDLFLKLFSRYLLTNEGSTTPLDTPKEEETKEDTPQTDEKKEDIPQNNQENQPQEQNKPQNEETKEDKPQKNPNEDLDNLNKPNPNFNINLPPSEEKEEKKKKEKEPKVKDKDKKKDKNTNTENPKEEPKPEEPKNE